MELAFSYARFSDPSQEDGDSLRRQDAVRSAWLKRHPEAKLDASVDMTDRGVSAFRGRHRKDPRNAMARFSELVSRDRVPKGSWLLIENTDRLSREHPEDSIPFVLGLVRAGIRIAVLGPSGETVFESGMDMGRMLLLLVNLFRGHDESARKSDTVGSAWSEKKRKAREDGTPMTSTVPAWLTLKDGKIVPVRDRVAVVRRIFSDAIAGYGLRTVAARLAADGVRGWGRSGAWSRAYLALILGDRRVLGEHQPMRGAVPDGPVIRGYYPAVVTGGEFQAAARASRTRRHAPGRGRGKGVNVFARLLRSAADGSAYHITSWVPVRRGGRRLVTLGSTEGAAPSVSFPYDTLEAAVLSRLRELNPADVLGEAGPDKTAMLAAEAAKLEAELAALERELEQGGDIPTVVRVVRKKEAALDAVRDELNKERAAAAHPAAESLGEVRTLADVLAASADPDDVRQRIKAALGRVLIGAWMHVVVRGADRIAAVQFDFVGGGRRLWVILHRAGNRTRPSSWSCLSGPLGDDTHRLDIRDPVTRRSLNFAYGRKGKAPAWAAEAAALLAANPAAPAEPARKGRARTKK